MPVLKNRMIFISHAWQYSEHYWAIVNWLNEEPNFSWSNCSVPSHDGLSEKTRSGLREGITRQIRPSQVVIILAGMYAAHSDWIEYEIVEAKRMKKLILAVRPWAQLRTPNVVEAATTLPLVGWNRSSIVQAIRAYI